MIAVIEPDSGEYFLGKTLLDALKKAEAEYLHKIFYSIRIGCPFAHQLKRGNQKSMKTIFRGKIDDFVPLKRGLYRATHWSAWNSFM